MDPVDAMQQLLQTYRGPKRRNKTLECCKVKLRRQAAEQRVEERCKMFARYRHPRRIIPLVDEVFLPHMLELKDRHRFLVLDGPSQVGKTTFCKQLCRKPEGYVEVDCTGLLVAPNLHVLIDDTELICFDECEPWYVAKYRKLFQGLERVVNLGDTNPPVSRTLQTCGGSRWSCVPTIGLVRLLH